MFPYSNEMKDTKSNRRKKMDKVCKQAVYTWDVV